MTETDDIDSDTSDDQPRDETAEDRETYPRLGKFRTDPDTTFADIAGLDEERRRLERTVLASMRASYDGQVNSTLLYGRANAGADRLAEALVTALAESGFTPFHISFEESRRRHGDPDVLAKRLDHARRVAPCVLWVDGLEHVRLNAGSSTRSAIERLQTDSQQVALVGVATLPEQHGQTVEIDRVAESQWADVRLRIDRPDTERCCGILENRLQQQCEDVGLNVDPNSLDLEETVEDVVVDDSTLLEKIAKRAATRGVTDVDAEGLQQDHLQAAAYNVTDEWGCGGTDMQSRSRRRQRQRVEDLASPSVPEVSFSDVGGHEEVIRRLRELLIYPREYADVFEASGVDPAHGVVLYGPPGTGKTLLTKAVANATDRSFLAVQGPELKNKWFGETERRVRELIERADENAPSVVFFDEFDAIAGSRDGFSHEVNSSVVATLLAELDGLEDREDVLFLAATNRPDALDDAVLRGGRFGEAVAVPLPDRDGRREILEIHAADLPTASAVTSDWFVECAPDGLSGADIEGICKRSLYAAIRDEASTDAETVTVERSHVLSVLRDTDGNDTAVPLRGFE